MISNRRNQMPLTLVSPVCGGSHETVCTVPLILNKKMSKKVFCVSVQLYRLLCSITINQWNSFYLNLIAIKKYRQGTS